MLNQMPLCNRYPIMHCYSKFAIIAARTPNGMTVMVQLGCFSPLCMENVLYLKYRCCLSFSFLSFPGVIEAQTYRNSLVKINQNAKLQCVLINERPATLMKLVKHGCLLQYKYVTGCEIALEQSITGGFCLFVILITINQLLHIKAIFLYIYL